MDPTVDIFSEVERDMMGVPITGSSRDRQLDAFRGMARQRFLDPLENRATNIVKFQVAQALSKLPGIKGEVINKIIALAESQDPDDKLAFNQIVSRLNLPIDLRRMGDDYMASKRFENALGDNSSVGISAYLPDEGKKQYSLSAEKRFPNFFGGEARVGGNISTGGDPEIRASFTKRFASGGEVDIFRDPVYEQMGLIFDPERNQYYENIEDPRFGMIRSYISPRDQGPVPELSEARQLADIEPDIARIAGQILSQAGPGVGSKPKGISDRSMSLARKIAADSMAFSEGAATDKSFQQIETKAREIIDRVKRGGAMIVPDAMNETFEQLRRSIQQDSKGFSSRGGMVSDKDMSRFRGIGSL